MSNREISICLEYEREVINRGRAKPGTSLLAPEEVDWADQPSRFKIYQGAVRVPLDACVEPGIGSLLEAADPGRETEAAPSPLSFRRLSTVFRLSNGITQRRMGQNWNHDLPARLEHQQATYARPAASGGGMYPFELYLVTGRGRLLTPGVYHYDAAHHALAQLVVGDVSRRVRTAVFDHPSATDAEYFVLVSLYFWKNYFKYRNFCYHVVTQDLGTALGALHTGARAVGSSATSLFWFRDDLLNRVVGLDSSSESVYAVVPVGSGPAPASDHEGALVPPAEDVLTHWAETPLTRLPSYQRSRRVFELPLLERLHRSTLILDERRPSGKEAARAHCGTGAPGGALIPLPPPTPEMIDRDLLEVYLARGSSFGNLTPHPPMSFRTLATLLRFAAASRTYRSDVRANCSGPSFTRLMVFIGHVQDVPPGTYAFDETADCLRAVRPGEPGFELQARYFLENYNFEQASAVLAVVGSVERTLEVFGNRGLRILNAEVGRVAQSIYMAASAMRVGCGAVLGFDNAGVNELLGLEGSQQTSLLLLLVGAERKATLGFDHRLI